MCFAQGAGPPGYNRIAILIGSMPERVTLAFVAYIDLGYGRSLDRLVAACKEIGVKAAIATPRRWSVQYNWQRRLELLETKRVVEIMSSLSHSHEKALDRDLSAIRTMQDRFVGPYRQVTTIEAGVGACREGRLRR
jgi:hypothetical protein